jgi:hypothetical protein
MLIQFDVSDKCSALVAAWFVAILVGNKACCCKWLFSCTTSSVPWIVFKFDVAHYCTSFIWNFLLSSKPPLEMPFLFWRQASLINCEERRWEVVCHITECNVFSLVGVVSLLTVFRTENPGKPVTCSRKGECVNFLSVLHSSCCSA